LTVLATLVLAIGSSSGSPHHLGLRPPGRTCGRCVAWQKNRKQNKNKTKQKTKNLEIRKFRIVVETPPKPVRNR
jgi:hypothetical protein